MLVFFLWGLFFLSWLFFVCLWLLLVVCFWLAMLEVGVRRTPTIWLPFGRAGREIKTVPMKRVFELASRSVYPLTAVPGTLMRGTAPRSSLLS